LIEEDKNGPTLDQVVQGQRQERESNKTFQSPPSLTWSIVGKKENQKPEQDESLGKRGKRKGGTKTRPPKAKTEPGTQTNK